MLIVKKNSTYGFAKKNAGGKAFNLYLLSQAFGAAVPNWFCLPPSFLKKYLDFNKLESSISENLERFQLGTCSAKECSKNIQELFDNASFPDDLSDIILKERKSAGFTPEDVVSVRSSAIDEDSNSHSFAGQLSSFLFVKGQEDLFKSIKDCWASAYSERGLIYRQQNKLPFNSIKASVIIQKMIFADKSGVIFTADPRREDNSTMIVNAVYGIGEGLVSGLIEGDTYYCDKKGLFVKNSEITNKEIKLVNNTRGSGVLEVPVSTELQNSPVLSNAEVSQLVSIALKIETFYQNTQDIEWALADGQFFILQARPITTNNFTGHGDLYIWDNSNIVESYGGHTLPLTFGFAHYVYHQVYLQFCEILLVPKKEIQKMDFFLKNMLGLFYGRVYYNLINWYKLTSILPGYKYNRNFMETMMGTNQSLEDEIAERVRPPSFSQGPVSLIRKVFTGFKFLYFHFSIQKIVDDFHSHFYPVYNHYRKKNYSQMNAHSIFHDYQQLEMKLLWKWHAPIINDFLCMVHYGIFKKLTNKWLSHLGEAFYNDLLAGNGNLESTEPTRELIRLAALAEKTPGLIDFLNQYPIEDKLEALKQSEYKEYFEKVEEYIEKFGFRCMSEMKLEQKDLHQDPSLFFIFLNNLLRSGKTDIRYYQEKEKELLNKAQTLLNENLFGIKKWIYTWSLSHARKAVRNRESTRFCRTRIYGVVRAMFFAIGNDFAQKNIIYVPEDIFYLSLEELKGSLEGTNTIQHLKKIIDLRKEEYNFYKTHAAPASRFITRGPVYWQNNHFSLSGEQNDETSETSQTDLAPNQLRGTSCCPGEVEGIAKVVLSPEDDLNINGEILVAMRTDPGWIPLYPSAKGLLVERGGLLSHSAIVAREMGLPTIVGIPQLIQKIKSGDRIRFNGSTGIIEILN